MQIQIITKMPEKRGGFVVYPIFQGKKADFKNQSVSVFLKDSPEFGKLYETQLLYNGVDKVLLVGVGKEELSFEVLQNFVGTLVKKLLSTAAQIYIQLPDCKLEPARVGEAVSEGAEFASCDPTKDYKSDKKSKVILKRVFVVASKDSRNLSLGLARGKVIGQSINLTRTLGDMPPNEMTPTYFLKEARRVAKENKLKIAVLTEAQAKRKGMGAFTAVSAGSDEPSFMIALEYSGKPSSKEKIAFVGKGVTFDSGGISIKPGEGMHEMKYDMCGAAAVLGAIEAAAKLKINKNIVAVMAVTENLPGGKAFKPGDIVRGYCGKTAEIINTDAEGRLLLLDAVSYAQKDFGAKEVVDLATLTGAMIVALGGVRAGIFSNDKDLARGVYEAGERVGEKYWEMPMDREYEELSKSDFADIANLGHGPHMGSREAGSVVGAKFVEVGVEKGTKWAHLDIAGVAWDLKERPFRSPGATGFGVKTLVELLA